VNTNEASSSNYDTIYTDAFTKDYNTENNIELCYCNVEKELLNEDSDKNFLSCWILDSGASINITGNLNLLIDIKKCNEEINLANGQIITAVHKGKFKGYVNNNEIILNEVYYSPAINKNLISICKLLKENYKIVFNNSNNKSYAIIYNSNDKKIVNINATKNNTFKIWFSNNRISLNNNSNQHNNLEINFTTPNAARKLNLWHRRLCHFDISHITNKLLKLNIPVNQCPLCTNSKLKNKPYKQAINKSKHSLLLRPLTNIPLLGIISIPSSSIYSLVNLLP